MALSSSGMNWEQIVLAVFSLFGGAGGIVALYRARSQNRTDERKLLTDEQIAFRSSMSAEIGRLSALQTALSADKDKLEEKISEQGQLIVRLQERDAQKEKEIGLLQQQNADLLERANAQQIEINRLSEEKAQVVQRLQVVQATKEFLERENGDLRRENGRLRAELDAARSGPPNGES